MPTRAHKKTQEDPQQQNQEVITRVLGDWDQNTTKKQIAHNVKRLSLKECVDVCNGWTLAYKNSNEQKESLITLVKVLKESFVDLINSIGDFPQLHKDLYSRPEQPTTKKADAIATSKVKYLYNVILVLNSINRLLDEKETPKDDDDHSRSYTTQSLSVNTTKSFIFGSDRGDLKKNVDVAIDKVVKYVLWTKDESKIFKDFLVDKREPQYQTPCRDLNNLLSFGLGAKLEWEQIEEILEILMSAVKSTKWHIYLHLYSCYCCIKEGPPGRSNSPTTMRTKDVFRNRNCQGGWSPMIRRESYNVNDNKENDKLSTMLQKSKAEFKKEQKKDTKEFYQGQDFYSMIVRSCDSSRFRNTLIEWFVDSETLQHVRTNTTLRLLLGLSLRKDIKRSQNPEKLHDEKVVLDENQKQQIKVFFQIWLAKKEGSGRSPLYAAVEKLKDDLFHKGNVLLNLAQLNHTLTHFMYVSAHCDEVYKEGEKYIDEALNIVRMLCQAGNQIADKTTYKGNHLSRYILSLIGLCENICVKYGAERYYKELLGEEKKEKAGPKTMEELQKRVYEECKDKDSSKNSDISDSLFFDRIGNLLKKRENLPKELEDRDDGPLNSWNEFGYESNVCSFQIVTEKYENIYSEIIKLLNSFKMDFVQVAAIEKGCKKSPYGTKLKNIMKPRSILARRWSVHHSFRNKIAVFLLLLGLVFGIKEQFALMAMALTGMVFILAHKGILEFLNPNPEYFALFLKLLASVCALLSLSSLFPYAVFLFGHSPIEFLGASLILIVFSEIVAHNEKACTQDLNYQWTAKNAEKSSEFSKKKVNATEKHTPRMFVNQDVPHVESFSLDPSAKNTSTLKQWTSNKKKSPTVMSVLQNNSSFNNT